VGDLTRTDEELHQHLRTLPSIPLSAELQRKILVQATLVPVPVDAEAHHKKRARRLDIRGAFAVSGAVVAACAALFFVWNGNLLHKPAKPAVTQATVNQGDTQTFGLKLSAYHVDWVKITSQPGEPKDSIVLAQITNTGKTPIHPTDVMTVLAFQSASKQDLLKSDWVTIIGSPVQSVQPGQHVLFSFHPDGAPHNAEGALTEKPQLKFFRTDLVASNQADTTLVAPSVGVKEVSAQPLMRADKGEAFQVTATITNHDKQAITLSHLDGIIWFGPQPSFLMYSGNRYITRLRPAIPSETVIPPGQSIRVYADLIGPLQTDYANILSHLLVVNR